MYALFAVGNGCYTGSRYYVKDLGGAPGALGNYTSLREALGALYDLTAADKEKFLAEMDGLGLDEEAITKQLEAYDRALADAKAAMDRLDKLPASAGPIPKEAADALDKILLGLDATERGKETTAKVRTLGAKGKAQKTAAKAPEDTEPLWQKNPSMTNTLRRKKDSVSISREGIYKMIEQLKAQKEAIAEQKEALIERAVANNVDMKDIQEPLAAYDEKIEMINERIQDILAQHAKSQAEKLGARAEGPRRKPAKEPETREEQMQQEAAELTSIAARAGKRDILLRAEGHIEDQAKIRTGELTSDRLRVEFRLLKRKADAAAGAEVGTEEMRSMFRERTRLNREIRQTARDAQKAAEDLLELDGQVDRADGVPQNEREDPRENPARPGEEDEL